MALLDDPNDDTRSAAADALGKLKRVQAADKLRQLLEDPQLVYLPLKWKAASALCRMRDAACLTFFRRIMASQQAQEYPQLKVDAAADMALFGSESEWIEQIRPLVASADPQVRAKAAVLIAPYDNASARNALVGLLQDPNPGDSRARRARPGGQGGRRLCHAALPAAIGRCHHAHSRRGTDPRADAVRSSPHDQ